MNNIGMVFLVGAGPGDPGLLTVKAAELIKKCDVLVYDRLVGPQIIAGAAQDSERLFVGKESSNHSLPQEEINQLIVDRARQGKMVVRLKGGDPFVFGRGGEEAEFLKLNGIPFEIVPGVTSAVAAPAYAGIPVTHRDFTSTLTIITGHERPEKKESSVPWEQIAAGKGTLVFLMGVENLGTIVSRLIAFGRSPDTPIALVRWGTLPYQEVLTGVLHNIADEVKARGFLPPAVIVVGEVVKLREDLQWFDNRPLSGRTIVVTRARSQASHMVAELERLGAQVIEFPTIRIKPIAAPGLQECLVKISEYSWLTFTSVNGVKEFINQLNELGFDIRDLKGPRICAIGPATAAEAESRGLRVSIIPPEYRAEAAADILLSEMEAGEQMLLPRARGAREILPVMLRERGIIVDELEIYEAALEASVSPHALGLLKDADIDLITFTSSSTVNNFVALIGAEGLSGLQKEVKVACIGPITANTAVEAGFTVDIIPQEYTVDKLVQAIVEFMGQNA
ncbi:MAG: uroporphyrinogen-III C-methyltransferase [Syntrophomonadaceae bacterium]|nr:uroporphyrinogen-III C-methyltransferase [Syntrophomonadaceae bacterium]